MREAIENLITQLKENATVSKKNADDAFEKGDAGLSGYYKGHSDAYFGTALALSKLVLEDTLKNHEEMNGMKQMENGAYEVTQLLMEAKENKNNAN